MKVSGKNYNTKSAGIIAWYIQNHINRIGTLLILYIYIYKMTAFMDLQLALLLCDMLRTSVVSLFPLPLLVLAWQRFKMVPNYINMFLFYVYINLVNEAIVD